MIIRRLALAASLVTALAFTARAEERIQLTAIDYDTIWTLSGNQLVGTITGTQPDGAVRFERLGLSPSLVTKSEILRIERRQNLAEAVTRRGDQAIAAGDWIDVQRVLRFVLEKQADPKPEKPDPKKPPLDPAAVKTAALDVARKALALRPTTEIAGLAIQLAWDQNDTDAVLGFAQTGVTADPNWTPGYENQAKVFIQQKQDDRMRELVKIWLQRQPTAFQANRYMAGLAEASGDVKTAAEAYRKGFDLHQDWESGLGYARCSLKKGDRDECARAAKALIDKGQFVAPAKVWLGAALLRVGTPEADTQAQAALEAGLAGELDPEAADVARYDLGVLQQRAGHSDEARKLWTQVTGPLGTVALAQLDRAPVVATALPPALARYAAEHNACIDLESKRWQGVLGGGNGLAASKRAVFLGQVATVLKTGGADDAIHNLAATRGDESLRWQAYGFLMQARFKEAEALLDKLPVTDGWAIAVRVYIASARKDDTAARSWLKRLDGAVDAPKQYAQVLIAEFASANDEVMAETFDWPDGDTVAVGWEVAAPGTNITAHARAGKLVLEGSQLGSEPTCVYRLVPAERMLAAEVRLDTANLATATGGLEVSDDKRKNGLQLGVTGGRVVWRAAENGVWGPWSPAALPAVGDKSGLRIEIDKGRLSVCLADNPLTKVPVAAGLGRSDLLAVGVFGAADQGTAWTLLADDLQIQLRPVARR